MKLEDFLHLYNFPAPPVCTDKWNTDDWVRYVTKKGKRRHLFFVSMIDEFMSGWGEASGKLSVFMVVCESLEEALQIKQAAAKRREMRFLKIHKKVPIYSSKEYRVDVRKFKDLGSIWTGKEAMQE